MSCRLFTLSEIDGSADHYPCKQPSCLEQKFVVFGNEMDLRAHLVTEVSS